MNEIDQKPTLEELTKPRAASGDADHLAWSEKKIRKAIADDEANPEGRASLDAIMRKHGVR